MGRRRNPRGGDRRTQARARFGGLFVNKYVDGLPHLAALLDLSTGGMMVRKVLEPELARTFFAVELAIPWTDERFWIWTGCVRAWGDRQALRFIGLPESDRARIAQIVDETRRAF